VETPGYWKLRAHNDFDNGALVKVNGVPTRDYHHKQILKFDFSRLGDMFTDSVRMTLTNLLNEVFVTLFADNQAFISATTPGSFDAPLTYSLALDEEMENADKCIFIIEDSQLDIGLLVAVERNVNRILQIITDYLAWNAEQIEESLRLENAPAEEKKVAPFNVYEEDAAPEKKKCFLRRFVDWVKGLFKKKKKETPESEATEEAKDEENLTPRQRRKAARAAKRAERKAAREERKARKKQEEPQEAPAEEAAEEATEETTEETASQDVTSEEASEEVPVAEPEAPEEQEEPADDLSESEETAIAEVPVEGEVSENA
jgi:hypothetical protein